MRLTNNLMSRNYLRGLSKNLNKLNDLNTKVTAQRRFLSVSEDPANAMKAFNIRKSLSRIDLYKNNISDIQGILDESESTISIINDTVTDALDKVLQGQTGTNDASSRKVIADALRSFQSRILNAANAKYGDKYLFGGNNVKDMPFTVDAAGKLLYKGMDVDTAAFSTETLFVDIGLGIQFDGGGNVRPESAMNVANSGIDLLGSGTDGNSISNNLYNLIGSIAAKFEANDMTDIQLYADKLSSKSDDIRIQYVGVGEKSNFISFLKDRLDMSEINASVKQKDLEALSLEEGILQFSDQELLYNACLQMGTKILQPSLLDYFR
ncbi:MAG: hypothetical protein AB9835_09430 [Eubacteriales bacterium]